MPHSTAYAVHRWDGGGADDHWSTAENWDQNTVPTAADWVWLEEAADVVVIPACFSAAAAYIQMSNGASLTIEDGGRLTISNANLPGLRLDDGVITTGNTSFTNNGTINITGTGSSSIRSNHNTTMMTNNGVININNTGLSNSSFAQGMDLRGTFNNSGYINIGPNIVADGIRLSNGTFNNLASGQINILSVGTGQDGITTNGGVNSLVNDGTICIEEANVDGANITGGVTVSGSGTLNTSACVATGRITSCRPATTGIPTLSEWGLIILALSFMTLGTLYLVQPNFEEQRKSSTAKIK